MNIYKLEVYFDGIGPFTRYFSSRSNEWDYLDWVAEEIIADLIYEYHINTQNIVKTTKTIKKQSVYEY